MAVHFPLFYLTDVYALEFAESFLPVFTQYKLNSNYLWNNCMKQCEDLKNIINRITFYV